MKTYDYMEQLEKMFEDSFKVPLSSGKIVVDSILMQDIIDEMRESLPSELKQAEAIVRDRNDIVTEARREAEIIMKNADEKARFLVSRDEIVKHAEEQAASIIAEAKSEANSIEEAARKRANDGLAAAKAQAEQIVSEATSKATELKTRADQYATTTVENANNAAESLKRQTEDAAKRLAMATNEYSDQLLRKIHQIMISTANEVKETHTQIKNDFEMK